MAVFSAPPSNYYYYYDSGRNSVCRLLLLLVVGVLVAASDRRCGVQSFNLEPRIPVIKHGSAGSYFGYSVAQHRNVVETANSSVSNSW